MALYLTGVLFIFISIFYLVKLIVELAGSKKWKVKSRLEMLSDSNKASDSLEPLNLPFRERIVLPAARKLGRFLEGFTPEELKKSLSGRLMSAGYTSKGAIINYLALSGMLVLFLPAFLIILGLISNFDVGRIVLYAICGLIFSIIIPVVILNGKKRRRQNEIIKSMPDMLDLLVVSVEAGLSFDAALLKVTEKMKCVLSDELNNVMNEVRMGKTRKQSLKEMADRTGVDELISFIGAIIQADQLGVGIGNVLRVQAQAMRTLRKQKAEEKALKAPVKMLFPLIFCIFPSLLMLIMGPAIIQIIKIFGEMK